MGNANGGQSNSEQIVDNIFKSTLEIITEISNSSEVVVSNVNIFTLEGCTLDGSTIIQSQNTQINIKTLQNIILQTFTDEFLEQTSQQQTEIVKNQLSMDWGGVSGPAPWSSTDSKNVYNGVVNLNKTIKDTVSQLSSANIFGSNIVKCKDSIIINSTFTQDLVSNIVIESIQNVEAVIDAKADLKNKIDQTSSMKEERPGTSTTTLLIILGVIFGGLILVFLFVFMVRSMSSTES